MSKKIKTHFRTFLLAFVADLLYTAYRLAQESFTLGLKERAADFSKLGHGEDEDMQRYNAKAAEALYEAQNTAFRKRNQVRTCHVSYDVSCACLCLSE